MREVELKSTVPDLEDCIARLKAAGAILSLQGRLHDSRYDTRERTLAERDETLRVRAYIGATDSHASLDWKGPTHEEDGYKVREEISTAVVDADATIQILGHLGYLRTMSIDREITQFTLEGATIRFERYPRMDDLVEIEGTREAIERAIERTGLPRHGFTSERLGAFVDRFEARTGVRAALSNAELQK